MGSATSSPARGPCSGTWNGVAPRLLRVGLKRQCVLYSLMRFLPAGQRGGAPRPGVFHYRRIVARGAVRATSIIRTTNSLWNWFAFASGGAGS